MMISFNPLGGHPWGQLGCQKKQKSVRNLNLLNWCSTFQSKLNKLRKTTRNQQKNFKNYEFFMVFRSSFNFDWKVEHQTKKFEFHGLFCFFWHPRCLQGFTPSGDISYFTFLFEILWRWCHLPIFSFYWKWRLWTPCLFECWSNTVFILFTFNLMILLKSDCYKCHQFGQNQSNFSQCAK